MASKLPHPSSADDFRKFRDRIKQSLPNGAVDVKWLRTNLAISQDSNARALLSALKGVGFLNEDGTLSERGKTLRGSPQGDAYKGAMIEAIEAVVGSECVDSIRAGILSAATLPDHFLTTTGAGQSMVDKALRGLAWLAREAGDTDLEFAFTKPKNSITVPVKPKTPKLKAEKSVRVKANEPVKSGNGATNSFAGLASDKSATAAPETAKQEINPEPPEEPVHGSSLLSSGVLSVHIDSGWALNDAREMIRMLQMVERGQMVPGSGAP